jgi:hypothetical protein
MYSNAPWEYLSNRGLCTKIDHLRMQLQKVFWIKRPPTAALAVVHTWKGQQARLDRWLRKWMLELQVAAVICKGIPVRPKEVTGNTLARRVCWPDTGIAGMQMAAVICMSNDKRSAASRAFDLACGPEQAIFDM